MNVKNVYEYLSVKIKSNEELSDYGFLVVSLFKDIYCMFMEGIEILKGNMKLGEFSNCFWEIGFKGENYMF